VAWGSALAVVWQLHERGLVESVLVDKTPPLLQATTTVYAHLINTDDHTGNMAAFGALAAPAATPSYGNVIPLHG
jgi:methylthioribose-1-phosphate isomerase